MRNVQLATLFSLKLAILLLFVQVSFNGVLGLSREDAECLGNQILNEIMIQKPYYVPSTFGDYAQIEQHGWEVTYDPGSKAQPPQAMQAILEYSDLKDITRGDWIPWSAAINVKGQEYELSWLIFPEVAIIVTSYFPPKLGQLDRSKIQRPSDILWLSWKKVCEDANKDPKNLAAVFWESIRREETSQILQQVAGDRIQSSENRRCGFSSSTKDGLAVLGTPTGASLGTMLLDRLKDMPMRIMSEVFVWASSESRLGMGMAMTTIIGIESHKPPGYEDAMRVDSPGRVEMRSTKFLDMTGPGPIYMFSGGFGSCSGVVVATRKGCMLGHYMAQAGVEVQRGLVAEGLEETINANREVLRSSDARAFVFTPFESVPNELQFPEQADKLAAVIRDELGLQSEVVQYNGYAGLSVDEIMEMEDEGDYPPWFEDFLEVHGKIMLTGGDSRIPDVRFEGRNTITNNQKREKRGWWWRFWT